MKIKPFYLHLFFGCATGTLITLLAINQLLVTTTYTSVPVNKLLEPSIYKRLLKAPIQPKIEQIYLQEGARILTADGQLITTIPEDSSKVQITWINSTPILSYESINNLYYFNLNSGKNLTNKEFDRLQAERKVTIATDCQPLCSIVITDLIHNKNLATIPAFTEPSYAPSLNEVTLLFTDVDNQLVAYLTPDKEIYVVTFKLELLQKIRLENERNRVEYLGYFPNTKQLAFQLVEKSNAYKQIALYAADRPSLYLLEKVPVEAQINILEASNALAVGKKVIDLQGETIVDSKEKIIIAGQ
jgi:hypothetical protein